jgi:hypothetical protein
MTKFSRERINHLARLVLEEMTRTRAVVLLKDREVARQALVHALSDELKHEEERVDRVRLRISGMKNGPSLKSREYDAIFNQMMEEEYAREGLTF